MRTLTIVFIGLVALPAGTLAWLGFQYVDALEGDSLRVIERETDARFEAEIRRVTAGADEVDRLFDERAEQEAREVAARLPFDGERHAGPVREFATALGTVRTRTEIATAAGEPLGRREALAELPEWERFIAARDTAAGIVFQLGDRRSAAARLRAEADEFVSPRLRDRLLRLADMIREPEAQRELESFRPVATAELPYGSRLVLMASLGTGTAADASESRGLGWRERVLGPLTRAGASVRVHVEHPRAAQFSSEVRQRKLLTVGGIAALLLLMVVGLWLARRALVRERSARQLRDAFITNVSHELKTPLTSVRMYAEMLADDEIEGAKREEYGRVVEAEGARLAALVDDMLDFSALERGARDLEVEPTDVARLACATVEAWRPLAEREGVVLDVDGPREGVVAIADPSAVGRIVTNLLQNALKHGAPPRDGEQRRIRVCIDGVLAVCDNGPGIPEAERELVFDRFRRGAGAGNKAGAGIGLALSRELARAMSGELIVEDDGTWTRFLLRLPPASIEPA